jgi:hypothetical protein
MMYRNSARLLFTALIAAAAGCADSTAPGREVTDVMLTRDAASDAADATAQDIAQMVGGEALSGLPMATAPEGLPPGGCTWSAATGRYTCPSVTNADGLTLARSFAYYAGGAAQQSYDATATDSINFQTSLIGTIDRDGRTAWINSTRSMTVGGLAGAETQRSWNGSGTRSDSAHVVNDGVARRTRTESVDQIESVVFALPRSENPYPKSGTITHDITISSLADNGTGRNRRSATRHVVVTFDGTPVASVMVGSTACTLDLSTRKLSCPTAAQ